MAALIFWLRNGKDLKFTIFLQSEEGGYDTMLEYYGEREKKIAVG